MTLTPTEKTTTASDLATNLALSGLTAQEIADDLGISTRDLENLATVRNAHPSDVWFLRDYLIQAIEDQGKSPQPFAILTPSNRIKAQQWFMLSDPPHYNFRKVRPQQLTPEAHFA